MFLLIYCFNPHQTNPITPQGLDIMILSDFMHREEYYLLLNDESSII